MQICRFECKVNTYFSILQEKMEKKTKKDEEGGLLRQSHSLRRRQMMAKGRGANGEERGRGKRRSERRRAGC